MHEFSFRSGLRRSPQSFGTIIVAVAALVTVGLTDRAALDRLAGGADAVVHLVGIIVEQGANIEGQLLGTRGEFGYVITDIGSECTPEMAARLLARIRKERAARRGKRS